jgi:Fe-S cluster assembly protein SufB
LFLFRLNQNKEFFILCKDMEKEQDNILNEVTQNEYKYGFTTDVETDYIAKGLSEDVVRIISAKKTSQNLCSNIA